MLKHSNVLFGSTNELSSIPYFEGVERLGLRGNELIFGLQTAFQGGKVIDSV